MHFGLVCQNVFGTDWLSSINKKKEKKKRTMAEALLLQSRFWVGIDIKMWPG